MNVYNRFASLLALLALATAVLLLIPGVRRFAKETGADAVFPWVALTIAVLSTAGSLTYAIAYDFTPCELCWYQRIAMYPLVLVLGVGTMRGDAGVWRYAVPLSVVGLVIAVYHVAIQWQPTLDVGACTTGVPCSGRYVAVFGYVSIPTMAAAAFALITVLMMLVRHLEREG